MTDDSSTVEAMADRFKALLAVGGNGAVEANLPDGLPLRVVLVGPIKTWWGRIDSDEYKLYAAWRELVRAELIHNCRPAEDLIEQIYGAELSPGAGSSPLGLR